ncbi:hypothetical protein F9K78_07005 [Brucella pseudintermedia]|nr:hypothetical protein F9K78_07005 [Brucella pseudintermedia]
MLIGILGTLSLRQAGARIRTNLKSVWISCTLYVAARKERSRPIVNRREAAIIRRLACPYNLKAK